MPRSEAPAESSASKKQALKVHVEVDPGICGFYCRIRVFRPAPKTVEIEISASECRQIRLLSKKIGRLSLRDLFTPLTRNPVFVAAEAAGCHTSCVVPTAVLKAAEAALEMALPKEVYIRFVADHGEAIDE